MFDPLGINPDKFSELSIAWDNFLDFFLQTFESTSGTRKERPSSTKGVAGMFLTRLSNIQYLPMIKI